MTLFGGCLGFCSLSVQDQIGAAEPRRWLRELERSGEEPSINKLVSVNSNVSGNDTLRYSSSLLEVDR